MNPDYEKQLEHEIDRELQRLPELAAPDTLASRVMNTIAQRAAARDRWAWSHWPLPLRVASLVVLFAVFGGLCFAGVKVFSPDTLSLALQNVSGWFPQWTTVFSTIDALFGALVLVVKQLGTPFLVGILLVTALNYAACIGVGTVFVRLALALRKHRL